MLIELVMPSNHLILCSLLLLLPSIFPSIRVFSNRCQDIICLVCSSGLWEHISHLWVRRFSVKTSHFFQHLSGGQRGETINLRNMQIHLATHELELV